MHDAAQSGPYAHLAAQFTFLATCALSRFGEDAAVLAGGVHRNRRGPSQARPPRARSVPRLAHVELSRLELAMFSKLAPRALISCRESCATLRCASSQLRKRSPALARASLCASLSRRTHETLVAAPFSPGVESSHSPERTRPVAVAVRARPRKTCSHVSFPLDPARLRARFDPRLYGDAPRRERRRSIPR